VEDERRGTPSVETIDDVHVAAEYRAGDAVPPYLPDTSTTGSTSALARARDPCAATETHHRERRRRAGAP
jgi:hypothetical protein